MSVTGMGRHIVVIKIIKYIITVVSHKIAAVLTEKVTKSRPHFVGRKYFLAINIP